MRHPWSLLPALLAVAATTMPTVASADPALALPDQDRPGPASRGAAATVRQTARLPEAGRVRVGGHHRRPLSVVPAGAGAGARERHPDQQHRRALGCDQPAPRHRRRTHHVTPGACRGHRSRPGRAGRRPHHDARHLLHGDVPRAGRVGAVLDHGRAVRIGRDRARGLLVRRPRARGVRRAARQHRGRAGPHVPAAGAGRPWLRQHRTRDPDPPRGPLRPGRPDHRQLGLGPDAGHRGIPAVAGRLRRRGRLSARDLARRPGGARRRPRPGRGQPAQTRRRDRVHSAGWHAFTVRLSRPERVRRRRVTDRRAGADAGGRAAERRR